MCEGADEGVSLSQTLSVALWPALPLPTWAVSAQTAAPQQEQRQEQK